MFRWLALAMLLTALGVSAWHRSRARFSTGTIPRRDESAGLIAGRLIVGLPLFGGAVVYIANPSWMGWASIALPTWLRWSGLALGVLIVPTLHWVLRTLGSNVSETVLTKEQHELVTSGPYRWVRHPLYVAGIGLFLSLGLLAASLFILIWTAVALVAVRLFVVPREESALISKFGDAYQRYQARTGALVPCRLRGYTSTEAS
jgi:protein-S-isoprenylcysteine O-methyltransferase Ste14